VLLSDALWRGRFGADAAIAGRQIHLNGSMHTVIGVMPPDFQFPATGLEAWVPAVLEPGELTRETINNYRVVARLVPRATLESARREVTALAKRLGNTYRWNAGAGFTVDGMLDDAVRDVRPARLSCSSGLFSCSSPGESVEPVRARAARSGELRCAWRSPRARLIARRSPKRHLYCWAGCLACSWRSGRSMCSVPLRPRPRRASRVLP
jgi:hypothetical protein